MKINMKICSSRFQDYNLEIILTLYTVKSFLLFDLTTKNCLHEKSTCKNLISPVRPCLFEFHFLENLPKTNSRILKIRMYILTNGETYIVNKKKTKKQKISNSPRSCEINFRH